MYNSEKSHHVISFSSNLLKITRVRILSERSSSTPPRPEGTERQKALTKPFRGGQLRTLEIQRLAVSLPLPTPL